MPQLDKKKHGQAHAHDDANHVALEKVPTWMKYYGDHELTIMKYSRPIDGQCEVDADLNSKISIWQGNITHLQIDSIVNVANSSQFGGGNDVVQAMDQGLRAECKKLNGDPGSACITRGHNLPCKFIIHTVAPTQIDETLEMCYSACFDKMLEHNLRTIAIPCIHTDDQDRRVVEIPIEKARNFLQENRTEVDRVIFCLRPAEVEIYEQLMQAYFPVPPKSPHRRYIDEEARGASVRRRHDDFKHDDATKQAFLAEKRCADAAVKKAEAERLQAEADADLKIKFEALSEAARVQALSTSAAHVAKHAVIEDDKVKADVAKAVAKTNADAKAKAKDAADAAESQNTLEKEGFWTWLFHQKCMI